MSSLHLAVLELTSGEDVGRNVDQILEILKGVPKQSPLDLICLPENALFLRVSKTTPMRDVTLDDPDLLRLQAFANERSTAILVGSIPYFENNQHFNATVFLQPGKSPEVVYRKIHLFDVDVPGAPPSRESETFRHGPTPAMIEWKGWKIGLSICYDLRFSELYHHYGQAGVDLIVIPSAFLVPTGSAHWDVLVRARAIENQCFVAASAQGGEHVSVGGEKRYTYGHSMVVGPWGEKLVELTEGHRLGVAILDKATMEKVRRQIPMRQHREQRNWERA